MSDQGIPTAHVPTRPHLIRRPRLTDLLDSTSARLILLCAPAGYGKTTLAREWIIDRGAPNAWYDADDAAADPAALARGLSDAAAHLNRVRTVRVHERLAAAGAPIPEISSLAALLADEFEGFPADAWIVIDDYHLVLRSEEADELVARFVDATDARFVIASRTRPEWLSARSVLYGEVLVVDRGLLAMTPDEAHGVFVNTQGLADEVVRMAAGWPAVVGLAALAGCPIPQGLVPIEIYDYIAEELLSTIPLAHRNCIYMLGLVSPIDCDAVRAYAGDAAGDVIWWAIHGGFITPTARLDSDFEMHPLIRSFLLHKLRDLAPAEVDAAAASITHYLLGCGLWDQAFELVARFPTADLFSALLEHAIAPVVDRGRVRTLDRWLEASAPYSDLAVYAVGAAQAELMRGAYDEALALSLRASETLDPGSKLLSRAYRIAGTSAHMLDDEEAALALYTRARSAATSEREEREAIWGQVLAAAEITDATRYVDDFTAVVEKTADDELAVASVRMLLDARSGIVGASLGAAWNLRAVLPTARDPMIRTGFLNMLSNTLSLAGRYSDARAVADEELTEAMQFGLPFIEPYALCNRALAAWGLRDFALCDELVQRIQARQHRHEEIAYLAVNLSVLRARSFLATGQARQALDVLEHYEHVSTGVLQAEHRCVRALALAATSEFGRAAELLRAAEQVSASVEVRALAPAVRAVIATLEASEQTVDLVSAMLDRARSSGNVDAIVLAYRTCPSMLHVFSSDHPQFGWLTTLARRCRDQALLERTRAAPSGGSQSCASLTHREHQILEMVAEGFTNNEISRRLFVSDATVKAHLRSVYRKLGVRTRTQAVLRFLGASRSP